MSRITRCHRRRAGAILRALVSLVLALVGSVQFAGAAFAHEGEHIQIDIAGPTGSERFGTAVYALPNGNFVVVDPLYDAGATANVGAVSLYDGSTLALISQLTGGSAEDKVGDGGVTVLASGNFVVRSLFWDGPGAADAGAVTWASGVTGVNGAVSATNSLVGATVNDLVGNITVLANDNYVISSPQWDGPGAPDAGAVTWGSGASGVSGAISADNSLVGSTLGDGVGNLVPALLIDGDYVLRSPMWDAPGAADAGAATWANGNGGTSGTLSAANSLVGSTASDVVSNGAVTVLTDGDYVVNSLFWDSPGAVDGGAATWGNGNGGTVGVVSAANSLIGSTASDNVGYLAATALADGDYVVNSPNWDSPTAVDAGAATWGNGDGSTVGVVSAANSLVGSTAQDRVSEYSVAPLADGDYVVNSPGWDSPTAINAGAATWGNGNGGTVGAVSAANSLIGGSENDRVGEYGLRALPDGDYVVNTRSWDGPSAADAGAVTWGNGNGSTVGVVSSTNSLVGGSAGDEVGSQPVTVLADGDYVVRSPLWDGPGAPNAGAVTWGNGAGGAVGAISPGNSLVGSTTNDNVGNWGEVTELTDGDFVVRSPEWDGPGAPDAGAVTWAQGNGGTVGAISPANSLVGAMANDRVGAGSVMALAGGHYVVSSPEWNAPAAAVAGAVTWGNGSGATVGPVSAANSLVGGTAFDHLGEYGVIVLTNGDYVVNSPMWDRPGAADVGAVTWGSNAGSTVGLVSAANSLVGSKANDNVGYGGVFPLAGGDYVVRSYNWDGPSAVDAGAVTWAEGEGSTVGAVNSSNSVLGTTAGGGNGLRFAFDPVYTQLVVGRPYDNIVTVFAIGWTLTVTKAGTGTGSVSSTPAAIDCGSSCTATVRNLQTITLAATPDTGHTFAAWSDACGGGGVCVVSMDGPKTVMATFERVAAQFSSYMPIAGR